MWRTHKARGETSWPALSRLPVAQCRIRGISNGNNLVQSLFLIPPPMEEQHVFSNSILYLCMWQLGDRKQIKTTAEYLLSLSSPPRQKPTMPVESTLWVFISSQCLLPTASLTSSLCRQLGRGGVDHCCVRSPSSVLLVINSLHSACSSAQAVLSHVLFVYAGKGKKQNK